MHVVCINCKKKLHCVSITNLIIIQAPSSTASTPNKSHQPPFPSQQLIQGSMTDPLRFQQASRQKKPEQPSSGLPQLSGALANSGDEEDDLSDEGSEGEINNSVTISALLSKLDSVRVSVFNSAVSIMLYTMHMTLL